MYNAGKIIIGLIIFAGLVTSPFWLAGGRASPPPKLELGTKEKQCVEATAYMKSSHMLLLQQWRDDVVRDGKRLYTNSAGKTFEMSLQNTCTKCHAKKTQFCDRCHTYVDSTPKCWDCHIAPVEQPEAQKQAARSDQ